MSEERKLATIREIGSIRPIPDADRIELATVDGWQVVVEKGLYKPGDLVVYVEIDSILDPENPEFQFMAPRRFRVKTIKLRKQISQGIIFPITIIPSLKDADVEGKIVIPDDNIIGMDVTEALKIVKYIDEIPANLAGKVRGNFPIFIPKTDEERIQNMSSMWDNLRKHKYYVTEKLDGSSFTCYLNNGVFGVCSRNIDLLETEDNTLWKMARELDLEQKMRNMGYLGNFALQGELLGNGIQKNKYHFESHALRIFNVFDIDNQKYYDMPSAQKVAADLELNFVPILEHNYELPNTIDELLTFAEGKSMLNKNTEREGLVLRNRDRNISFKVISNKFLLKNDE